MKKIDIQTLLQYMIPKFALTVFAGFVADLEISWLKNFIIHQFIKQYQVNMAEALEVNPERYPSFNAFFIRKLNPKARPLVPSELICPVDGILSETGRIQQGQLLQAKGRTYTLSALLDEDVAHPHTCLNGYFSTFYLSPKDYHRIHMPIDGKVTKMIYLPGKLFSVQPATVRMIPELFAKNERVVVYFDTPKGELVMVLVGATIVGKIATAWHGEFKRSVSKQVFDYTAQNITLKQGEEMGYFKLGSTVILLLESQPIPNDAPLLQANTPVKLYQKLV
jgi:phosphatidylserine decarboxylase